MCKDDVTVIIEEEVNVTTVVIEEDCEDITIISSGLGEQGLSAYQIALANGFVGTEEEWLNQWVPYTGASKDVDLGTNKLKADSLEISTESTETVDVGKIVWNAIDGTFDMGLIGGVTLQAGQEMHIYGKASEAISNGDAVQFAGVQGDHILIKKAVPSEITANPEYFIGIATQSFSNNQFGYTTIFGNVRGLNTSAYTLGSVLYFDSGNAENGKLTATIPTAPNAKIIVAAVVRSHQNEGMLMVRPHVMPKIKDLQDINASAVIDNQGLYYNATTASWDAKYSWFQCASGFATIEWITNTEPLKEIKYNYTWGSLWRKINATIDNFYTDSGFTIIYQKKKI